MKRRLGGVVGALLALAAVVLWWCADDAPRTYAPSRVAGTGAGQAERGPRRARPDPRMLARGALAGTVTDETRAPIADAQVCAQGESYELDPELLREPTCTTTDRQGAFELTGLYPARYTIGASARRFLPAVHHPGGDRREVAVQLDAGEREPGIDIALRAGGVELTGVVADLTGGPIAGARVTTGFFNLADGASAPALARTAADGTFSLWVPPGTIWVSAAADGYADATKPVKAPGRIELLLTPSASLGGIVVDAASGSPVEGALVETSSDQADVPPTFTDARGAFRLTRLVPARYTTIARTDRGYGRAEGSTLVGLGQHVDGVIVRLFPATRVEGKVIGSSNQRPCRRPRVLLADEDTDHYLALHGEPDGTVWADGVLPGTYTVTVDCRGYLSRARYAPVVVAAEPVSGLVWEVDPGATIRGRVLTRTGAPVVDARVTTDATNGDGYLDASGGDGATSSPASRPGPTASMSTALMGSRPPEATPSRSRPERSWSASSCSTTSGRSKGSWSTPREAR